MQPESIAVELTYGRAGRLRVELLGKRLLLHHAAPPAAADPQRAVRQAMEQPLEFPELHRAFVADDHVAVVIDPDTPWADLIVAELWKSLSRAGLTPENVALIQPATWKVTSRHDPRGLIPVDCRQRISLKRHDPTDNGSCAYLASTASGERVYLARELTEADVVLTIGPAEYDPVLGVRGTVSSLYPGLSDLEALRKSQGQGHEELGPGEVRPLRQLVDEIGWLLGLQLSIAVVPSSGSGALEILIGQTETVLQQARKSLAANWLVKPVERAELVLVTVTADAAGHGWDQVAAAIDVARRLVERNGRIIVLTELQESPGPGMDILRSVREPREALRLIQQAHPPDLIAAFRVASAADWANVALLSPLPPDLVEDLFLVPLESPEEVQRLLQLDELTAIVESAQHACVLSDA